MQLGGPNTSHLVVASSGFGNLSGQSRAICDAVRQTLRDELVRLQKSQAILIEGRLSELRKGMFDDIVNLFSDEDVFGVSSSSRFGGSTRSGLGDRGEGL